MQTLKDLLKGVEMIETYGDIDISIGKVTSDSRTVEEGSLFVAVNGFSVDGNKYVNKAIENGAKGIISEVGPDENCVTTWVKVSDVRASLANISDTFYSHPSGGLKLIGITGTNGKTTLTYLLEAIFEADKQNSGVIGTVNYRYLGKTFNAPNTTPESIDLQKMLRDMKNEKVRNCIIEVSSHSLALDRVKGCDFEVAIFTNLSQDHLDFHENLEDYFQTKLRLFTEYKPKVSILNIDDEYGLRIAKLVNTEKLTYGIKNNADVWAKDIKMTVYGTCFTVKTPKGDLQINTKLIGNYNVYNILGAIACAVSMNVPLNTINEGILSIQRIPGRFEPVGLNLDFKVIVDYAHTDDALKNVLRTAREITKSKLITVFGCGGDRDSAKRPLMAKVSGSLSDFTIVTSDNPRTEDPLKILDDIRAGFKEICSDEKSYKIIEDRRTAISFAIDYAGQGDVIVIAGKGHEDYQIIGEKKFHFDDIEVVKEAIENKTKNEVMFSTSDIEKAVNGVVLKRNIDVFYKGVSIDSRTVKKGDLFICIKGENFDGHDFIGDVIKKGAIGVIVDREREYIDECEVIIVKDTLLALGDLASFHRKRFNIPVIAVTGSNGKTTTKELIFSVLSERFNTHKNIGNLNNLVGVPLTLLNLNKKHEACIVEMGMNQKGEIKRLFEIVAPTAGVVTNISDAHIGNFNGLDEIKHEKLTLFKMLGTDNVALVNCDDPLIFEEISNIKCKTVKYGLGDEFDVYCTDITHDKSLRYSFNINFKGAGKLPVSLLIPGLHNIYNALSAAAIGKFLNLTDEEIKNGVSGCREVEMRMQVREGNGFTVINDAYNANPASVNSALLTLSGTQSDIKKIFIFGDMLELGEKSKGAHSKIGKKAYEHGVDVFITIGDEARHAALKAKELGMNEENVYAFKCLDEAKNVIKGFAKDNNCLLFKASRGMRLERVIDKLFNGEGK